MVDPAPPMIEKGTWRHVKSGKLYDVLGVALHTETDEWLVVYRPKYDTAYELFVRPYGMFCEWVEIDGQSKPRFEKVADV